MIFRILRINFLGGVFKVIKINMIKVLKSKSIKSHIFKITAFILAFFCCISSVTMQASANEDVLGSSTGPGVSPTGSAISNQGSTVSYYDYQWGLKNTGRLSVVTEEIAPVIRAPGEDFSFGYGWGWGFGFGWGSIGFERVRSVTQSVEGMDINAEPAWNYYEQSTNKRQVVVALIDTGVDTTHSELSGSIWVNADEIEGDGIDNDANGYIDDVNGWNFYENSNVIYRGSEDEHGTHGAGTIAAAWNGQGVTGIADSNYVKIMVLKVFGSEDSANFDGVKAAIRYAEANGASICNLSMGTASYDADLEALMANSTMLFVVSAGNGDYFGNGYNIDNWPIYPAAFSSGNIISVANMNFDGSLAGSSNYGPNSVDIAAPGTYILSTTPGGGYEFLSGTSMSAPMVTGVAALIYSCRTDMSIMDVRNAILSTARSTDTLSGCLSTGGMIDAYAAITYGLKL